MTTYRYSGPTRVAVRSGVCPVCGKRGKRQTTIQNTVNPFNRNPDRTVRTWGEVAECVRVKAAEWSAVPFVHAKCEQTR